MGEVREAEGLIEVRLIGLPLDIWQLAQEHIDGLLREFALIAQDDEAQAATPRRLLALIAHIRAGYEEFSAEQRRQMVAALQDGRLEIDLAYRVPAGAGPAARQLGDLLDEADDYCRRGDHLLTMTTPPEALRFRRWFLRQFLDQLADKPPVAWTEFSDGPSAIPPAT